MENIREIVSANIINLRKQNKMTQLDLAKKVNFSDKAISRWEKGEVLPDIETLAKLAEVFNVPISYILENQGNQKPRKITTKEILSQVFTVCEIWTIISVAFAYLVISRDIFLWQLFLWGVPATALILLALNKRKDNNIVKFIYGTIFVWSVIVCVFLHMLNSLPWYIFIVGVPIQGLLVVRYLFNFKQGKILPKNILKKNKN